MISHTAYLVIAEEAGSDSLTCSSIPFLNPKQTENRTTLWPNSKYLIFIPNSESDEAKVEIQTKVTNSLKKHKGSGNGPGQTREEAKRKRQESAIRKGRGGAGAARRSD